MCPLLLRKMLIPHGPVSYPEVVSDLVLEQHFGGWKERERDGEASPSTM